MRHFTARCVVTACPEHVRCPFAFECAVSLPALRCAVTLLLVCESSNAFVIAGWLDEKEERDPFLAQGRLGQGQ